MKKLLYTVMCCCALASCTNLDSERYDAINPDFFPTNEKDAEALVVGGVYAPFRSSANALRRSTPPAMRSTSSPSRATANRRSIPTLPPLSTTPLQCATASIPRQR